jgi:hypothetical protein
MADIPADGEVRCLQCDRVLAADEDRETTSQGVFCRGCFEQLRHALQQAVRSQGEDVNYPAAALGGGLGGAAGALVWWGFTALTGIAFGLVAIVIGFAVGWGVVRFSGGKRSRALQGISVAIAAVSYVYGDYLVNRTFINRQLAAESVDYELPWLPSPELFIEVVRAGFDLFSLVFLAIVLWEAWRRPAPVRVDLG